MDFWTPLTVLSRWIHVGTAIVLVGGTVYLRYVLMPAAAVLPDDQHEALRERLTARWRKFVMIGIGLLLLSGGYNYLAVGVPGHEGDALYHALMGVKMLLALAIFFLASALAGRAKAFNAIRETRRKWLAVIVALAAVVVGISGYLKVAHPTSASAPNALEELNEPADEAGEPAE